jgi:DNA-binding response OmpR family regulator
MPIIVVASEREDTADEVARRLRREGAVVLATHSMHGCLRVATSVRPDIVVLDAHLPPRLERLLRAHPTSAGARLFHLSPEGIHRFVPTAASLAY